MTKYKKTETKPCKCCEGSGKRLNKFGVAVKCTGCDGTSQQKHTTVIEELPDTYNLCDDDN